MRKATRKFIFYLLFGLFFLIGGTVLLYAQGWRVDLNYKTIVRVVKVGAVSVRPYPEGALVTLSGKPIKKHPSLFSNAVFLNNVVPEIYTLRVTDAQYHPWEKKIEVLPSRITQLEQVVLVPLDGSLVIPESISSIWGVGETVVLKNSSGDLIAGSRLLRGTKILATSPSESFIVTYNPTTKKFFLEDTIGGTSTPFSSPSTDIAIVPDQFSPLLVAAAQNGVHLIDPASRNTASIIRTTTQPTQIHSSSRWVAWVQRDTKQNASLITLYSLLSRTTSSVRYAFPHNTTKIEFSKRGTLAALQEGGGLFLIDPDAGVSRPIASDVRDFTFSENGSFIAALESKGVEVISPDSPSDYWRFEISDIGAATGLSWYRDYRHLFVHYPDHISFLDFEDEESLDNYTTVAETARGVYLAPTNELYYLERDALLKKVFAK